MKKQNKVPTYNPNPYGTSGRNPKAVAYRWEFQSSSGKGTHETLLYYDGTLSCSCPGWTKRSIRSCKHTRMVEAGKAHGEAIQHGPITGKVKVVTEPETFIPVDGKPTPFTREVA